MKSFFIKIIPLIFLISGSFLIHAQQYGIDTIYINPVQPNSNDSIDVIAVIGSSRTPSRLDSVAINIIDSNITVEAYYILGIGSSPSFTIDTVSIGELTPKRYKLKYNAIQKFKFNLKSDSLYFTVNQVIGINERNNPLQSVSVYPNPSGELINLNVQLEKAITTTIRITDTQGKLVYNEEVRLEKGEVLHSISSKKLSSGIYHLSVWNKEQLLNEQKIIVQH